MRLIKLIFLLHCAVQAWRKGRDKTPFLKFSDDFERYLATKNSARNSGFKRRKRGLYQFFVIFYLNTTLLGRVVGGTDVRSTSEFPFFVTLKSSKYGSPWCGGTILDEYNILTAAHCIARGRPPKYIKAGSVNRDGTDGYIIRIAKCTSHPETKRTSMGCTKNDLQVCRLEKPIPLCKLLSIKKTKLTFYQRVKQATEPPKHFQLKWEPRLSSRTI